MLNTFELLNDPQETISRMADEPAEKIIQLAHTFFNSLLLNVPAVLLISLETGFSIVSLLVLILYTFVSIIAIEFVIDIVARQYGETGNFWKQLRITNTYLGPIFVLVNLSIICDLRLPGINCGLIVFIFMMALYSNSLKIQHIYKRQDTFLYMLLYGVGTALAYIVWLVLFDAFQI